MSEMLFDLAPIDDREGDDVTHVLMPNMAYACGGNILTKRGHFRVGASGDNWTKVTCPDCLAHGQDALVAESRRQQGYQVGAA